jgi:hypothetical protein
MALVQGISTEDAGDPCSLLVGSAKTECEAIRDGTPNSGGGTLESLLGINGSFDWRHFMIRASEFIVGVVLVIVAVNAGLKQEIMGNPVVKSAKQVARKVSK